MMQQSARALQQEDGHNIWQSTRALQQIDGRNIWQSTRACSPRPECSGMPFDASLSVIVTGFENSGTTVLSQLIMSSPHIFGAFECGLLLACSPREFTRVQPFHNWLPQLWRLPGRDAAAQIDKAACHQHAYSGLAQRHCWTRRQHTFMFSTKSCVAHQGCLWWSRRSRKPPSCTRGQSVVCAVTKRSNGTVPESPRTSGRPLRFPSASVPLTRICSRPARQCGVATSPICRRKAALRQTRRSRQSTAGFPASILMLRGVRGTLGISRSPHTRQKLSRASVDLSKTIA